MWDPRAALLLAAAAFLAASLWHARLPGLQHDESLAAAPAVVFLRGTVAAEPNWIRPSIVHVGGRPFPVMLMTYAGGLHTALFVPVFAVFGTSVVTLRALQVGLCLVVLLLAYRLAGRLGGGAAAAGACLALALDPTFAFGFTRGGNSTPHAAFALAGLLLGLHGWRSRRAGPWIAGGFVLGLAATHKADGLWLTAALVRAAASIDPAGLRARLRPAVALAASGAFALGAAPLIAFNAASGGATFAGFGVATRTPGDLLAALPDSLLTRASQLVALLDGRATGQLFFHAPHATAPFPVAVPAIVVGILAATAAACLLGRARGALRALVVFVALFLAASCFSPTSLGPHHLFAIVPVLYVTSGVALVRWAGESRARRRLALGAAALVMAAHAWTAVSINRALEARGGERFWSDAIYQVGRTLRAEQRRVVVLDWGLANPLIVLGDGTLAMEMPYRAVWHDDRGPAVAIDEEALYVAHAPDVRVEPDARPAFRAAAEAAGVRVELWRRFHQRDGREVVHIYRVARRSAR